MLDLLNTIVQYIVLGIQHILTIVRTIPQFLNYGLTLVNRFVPNFMLPYIILGLTCIAFIHIKRLIL